MINQKGFKNIVGINSIKNLLWFKVDDDCGRSAIDDLQNPRRVRFILVSAIRKGIVD